MRVEIWSDVICPWCYVGKRRFESALARFDQRDDVEVIWRSFELDPDAPRRRAGTPAEHLARKYGMTPEQVAVSWERLTSLAAAEGLEYHLDSTAGGNSFDAHRLIHLAAAHGKQDQMKERLLRAYLTESEAIGEPEVLQRLGVEEGLDAEEVEKLLSGERFAAEVRADERRAQLFGISGVPFFGIDERYGVSGAQSADVILATLEQGWAERAALEPA